MVPAWALAATSLVAWVEISMPSMAVMAQEGWGLGMGRTTPSRPGIATSTRHWRQLADGASSGWSQKRGMRTPTCSAARMRRVPFSTSTGSPSMVMWTISGAGGAAGAELLVVVSAVMAHRALSKTEEAA